MYETLPTLTEESITKLTDLQLSVSLSNKDIRLGASGINNISVYEQSKWTTWTREQKLTFKEVMGSFVEKAIVGWFLKFPANSGFLDTMNAWAESKSAGTIVAYALKDGQNIWINGSEVTVNKGEGIKFNLKHIHEVKPSNNDQIWACLMQLV